MKTRRVLRHFLCLFVLVSFVFGSITGVTAEEGSAKSTGGVSLEVNNKPKAEIALAVGQTKVDYSKFQEDLKAILEEKGIAQEDISFVQVDANASASKDSFVWWEYDHVSTTGKLNASAHKYHEYIGTQSSTNDYNSKTNHIVTTNNGKTMQFFGYGDSSYKDFNFMPNEQATKKTIQFTITEDKAYDALDGIGFLINTSITGTYGSGQVMNGYLLFLQYSSGGVGQTIRLFKLTNVDTKVLHHTNGANGYNDAYIFDPTTTSYKNMLNNNIELVATANTSYGAYKYRKIKIEVMPDYVKMWYSGDTSNNASVELTDSNLVKWTYNGSTVTEYPLQAAYDVIDGKEVFRGGYGPFASYRPHSCSQLTAFQLSNLSMEAEYVRSLTEVVREPSWTDDKVSILVNLNEAAIDDFSDVYSTAEIINRLQDDNVSYIGWCSDENYDDSQQFVTGVGQGSGLVNLEAVNDGVDPYSKDSYTLQLEAIAQLIMESLQQKTSVNNEYTFLASEELKFTALSGSLSDGNWSVGYSKTDYAAAKNNISTYQNLEHASFAQCGYYEIYHDGDIANPKAKIRIHDLPIAVFRATMTVEDGITVENGSYDPEFCLTPNTATGSEIDGIKTSIFEYYNLNAENPSWVTTAPESVAEGDAWLVRLTVEDFNGATATTLQQLSVTDEEGEDVPAPYGTFKLSSTQYIKGIDLFVDIIDQSYMLNGSLDFTVEYIITNSAGTVVWNSGSDIEPGSAYQYSLDNLTEGSYTISMTASNDSKTSEKVSRTFKVVQGYSVQYIILDGEGTGAPETQYKIKDQSLTLSNFAPSRSGYTFVGWEDAGGTMYQPGDKYLLNADLILTAKWAYNMSYTAEGYTGTYDAAAHGITINVTDSNSKDVVIKYGTEFGVYDMDEMPTYTNAGTYTVYFQITAEGCQTVTNSRTVVINKAAPTVVNSNTVVSYDGTAKELIPSVITGVTAGDVTTGTVTYTYYMDEECTILTNEENSGAATEGGAPVLKGIYYVIVSIAEDLNYSAYTSEVMTLTIRKYDVVFDMGGIGVAPNTITDVIAGSTIDEPEIPVSDDYIFIGWFKDANFETPWDFATDEVVDDTTLYAKWRAKSTYECHWKDPETGEEKYGTFDEAIDSGTNEIVIQNDIVIDEDVVIPSDVTITVTPSDVNITVADDIVFENKGNIVGGKLNGDLINNGTIEGAEITGSVDNVGGTIEDSTVAEDGKVSGGDIAGDTINKGTIDGSNISGNLDNTNGTIEDATIAEDSKVSGGDITGDTVNKGTIEGSNISGNLDNTDGTVEDSTVAEDGKVSGGDIAGDTINKGTIDGSNISGTLDNTNGTVEDSTVAKDGKVSGGDVKGNTVNKGTIDGSNISGTLDNTNGTVEDSTVAEDGKVSGGDVKGNTVNKGTIDGSNISGNLDNTNGTIEDSTVAEDGKVSGGDIAGDTINKGTIDGSNISGNLDNTNGTVEDSTVAEDGKVSGGDIKGSTTNKGTIEGSDISGTVNNAGGTIEDSTVAEDGKVSGGDITGDTINKGTIDGSNISGTLDNTGGTIEDSTVAEDGKVSGGDIKGSTTNKGTIEGSDISGTVNNAGGTIEDSTVAEDGKISGGDITGDTINKGTIDGSNISGTLDNTNGTVEDSTVAEDGKVSGGDIKGSTTNKGTIEGSDISGTVNNAGGTVEDSTVAEDGKISGGDIAGDTINKGTIEGSNISGNLDNTGGTVEDSTVAEDGKISGGDIAGDTINKGTIEGSNISGNLDNTNGTVEDSTVAEDGKVSGGDIAGDTINKGIIEGSNINGNLDNTNGTVEDSTVAKDGKVNGGDVKGNTVNKGTIEGSNISGNLDNTNGTVEDSTIAEDGKVSGGDIAGDTVNKGTIDGSNISGNLDNTNGTIEDATIAEDSKVSGGDITGDTVNKGTIEGSNISGNLDNTDGTVEDSTVAEDGKVSGGDIAGDTINKGTIDGSNISGNLDNTNGTVEDSTVAKDGKVSGGDITGDTVNKGTIEGSNIGGTVNNAGGTIEDATVSESGKVSGGQVTGNTVNKGTIEGSNIGGTVNNAGGTIEDATVSEGGKVSGGQVTGNTTNKGTIDGSNISGNLDNTGGTVEDSTVAEDGKVSGGDITGDTINKGTIDGSNISGNLDNTGGTVEDSTVAEDGKVSGGDIAGDTINKGAIDGSNISGNLDNTNGIVEDSTVTEDGTVSGGEVTGSTVNKGTIDGSIISGTLDNTDGTVEDATVSEDGTVSGGAVAGSTVNKGTIEGAAISGTLDNTDGTIEDTVISSSGSVTGGQVTGTTINNGTIEGAAISGTLNNTNGTIADAIVSEDGTVTGGNVTGNTVNNGVVEDVKVSGTVTGDGEVENDQEYVNEQIDKAEENLEDESVTDKTEVDFGDGKIQVDLVVNETPDEDGKVVVSGLIISSRKDVIDAVLSNDAKLDVINGKRVYIELVIEPMDNADRKEEIDQMKAMFDKDEKVVIGQILDIVIQKKIDESKWEKLSDLSNEIEIVIDVPENLRFSGATYYIVRNHNGECTVLQDLDDNPDTITFKTDRFSTYAIAYDKNDDCPLCGICPTPLGICVVIWIIIGIVIAAGVVVTVIIVRKRKNTKIELD